MIYIYGMIGLASSIKFPELYMDILKYNSCKNKFLQTGGPPKGVLFYKRFFMDLNTPIGPFFCKNRFVSSSASKIHDDKLFSVFQ